MEMSSCSVLPETSPREPRPALRRERSDRRWLGAGALRPSLDGQSRPAVASG